MCRMRWGGAEIATLAVVVVLAAPAAAAADSVGRATSDAGLGLATIVANAVYIPVKLSYAVVGGVTGVLAYVVTGGKREVAEGVWVPSIGGDYVLTRDMVAGRQKIYFSGIADPDL